jgi:hypothetical protein
MWSASIMNYFGALSAAFALLAAGLWLKSAKVPTPQQFVITVVKPSLGGPIGVLDGKYMGNGYSQELQTLGEALIRQSSWSAWAATSAAAAAVCQVIDFVVKAWAG